MKNRISLIALACMVLALISCKKYEDGPALSLRTKKSRLVNEWEYDYVRAANGDNITASYANSTIEFTKDETYISTIGSSTETGTWQFAHDKEDVVMTEPSSGGTLTLHITRLKARELWFTVEQGSGTYTYHMVPR